MPFDSESFLRSTPKGEFDTSSFLASVDDPETATNRNKVLAGEWDQAKFDRFMKYRETQDAALKALPDIAVPDTSAAMPGFQHPAPTEETAHPLRPLFDAMGWIKRKADIEIPGTGTEVLGHEFPGTKRRLFEPIPNPESDPIISITNALKGFLGLTPDIPEFLLKDLPEAVAGTFTPEEQLKPEAPTLGRVGKEMGRSTIDVMALAVMRQFHPEEYKRFIKTGRGKAIKEMEAERLHEPALLPLIASGAMGKVAKLTGKLGKAKIPLIPEKAPAPVRDIMPKLRYEPKAEAIPMMELPGIKKPKVVAVAEKPTIGKSYNITEGESFINTEVVGNSLLIKSSHVPLALRRKGIYTKLLKDVLRKAKKDHPKLEYFEGNVISEEAMGVVKRWKSTEELLPREKPPLMRTRIDEVLAEKPKAPPIGLKEKPVAKPKEFLNIVEAKKTLTDMGVEQSAISSYLRKAFLESNITERTTTTIKTVGENLLKKQPKPVAKPKVEPVGAKRAAKEPWEITRKEYTGKKPAAFTKEMDRYQARYQQHGWAIEEAVGKGKLVPAEVLKDYPELAGKVDQRLLAKRDRLKGKTDKIDREIEQRRKTDMPGTFITGRSGVPKARIRKLDRQLDKTIKTSTEYVKTTKELDAVERKIKSQEGAPQREYIKAEAAKRKQVEFDNIAVGDKIDIGGNAPLTVIKKNPKSVITEGGSKWTAEEIGGVTKPKAPPTRAKKVATIEEIPKSVSMQGGDRLYDAQFSRYQKLDKLQSEGYTHVKTQFGKLQAIGSAKKTAKAKSGGVVGFEKRTFPSERGVVLNIPKEIARPAGAEPVKYKEAIKTPDRPEMASMESYYKTIMAPEAFRPPAVEFAKQPGVARQIGIAERQTKGGKVVPAVRKAGTFVPEDFATYKNFKDAKQGVGGGTKDWIRYVQEIDGSLSLQKKAKLPGQAGPAEKYILRRTEDMVKIELDWSAEQSLRIKEITKGLSQKQERLVTEVLEETSRPGSHVETADFATNTRIRKITSDTKVVKAARESRKALEHWFSQQNKLRGLRNQELINYRQYYAPHILRETSLWERAFGGQVKAKEVVRGPQLPDYIKPNKPFNPRELAREIGLKNYMREMSIGKILEDYANTASRDIHHTSIIQNNKAFIQQLESMGYKNAAEGVGNFTAEGFGRVKAPLDRAFDFPVKVQKGMRFWRGSLMRSVFPLNWTWNTTVQTLSSGLTVMRTGITNSTRGLVDWFANPTMRNRIKSSYSYRIKSRRGGRITRQDINTGVTEMVQGRRSAWQAAIDGANYTTELVERHLTGWSIASGLRHGAKRGLKGKALWDYASDAGAKTQSMYNLENKPGILRSEIVQTAAPFQTFIFEMYNTAKEFAGRTGTPPGAMTERIGWVLRFTAAAYAGNEMANAITGRRPWDIYSFIPFSDQTIKPIIDKLRGKPYDAISGRGLPSFVGAGVQFAGAVRSYLRTGDTRKIRNWGLKYGTAFMKIPGGTQIARMVDGWIAVANEGMKDAGGRTLFKIKDPWEKVRAVAMGPWRTKAGIEYWEKRETNILEDILGKPKKKKRLSIVPDLNAMRR